MSNLTEITPRLAGWRRAGIAAGLLAGLLLLGSGCRTLNRDHKDELRQERAPTLEEMMAGMVPLPGDFGGEVSADDIAAVDAALAAAADGDEATFSESGDPILRPGLVVKVSVLVGDRREVDEARVQISDKNEVTLPMVGKVACDGITLPTLRSRLTERFGDFYRNPEVSAEFVYDANSESPWGRILVMGRVRTEGWINIPPTRGITVSRAIQLAGGFDTSARKDNILVTRTLPDGSKQRQVVNLMAVAEKGSLEDDMPLEPRDVVLVRQRKF